jgi:hypothetical protein
MRIYFIAGISTGDMVPLGSPGNSC